METNTSHSNHSNFSVKIHDISHVDSESLPSTELTSNLESKVTKKGNELLVDQPAIESEKEIGNVKLFELENESNSAFTSKDDVTKIRSETIGNISETEEDHDKFQDPLSSDDKEQIYKMLSDPPIGDGLKKINEWAKGGGYNKENYGYILTTLSKAWGEGSEKLEIKWDLKKAREIMGEESFLKLRELVRNPALVAKKLNIENKADKKFAAHAYLRAAVRSFPQDGDVEDWYEDTDTNYYKKLSGLPENYGIMPKNVVMMDPKYRVMNKGKNQSSATIVCSNAYIVSPKGIEKKWCEESFGSEEEYLEQSKRAVGVMVNRLSQVSDTKHVIDALAELERREKIQVFYSYDLSSKGIHPKWTDESSGLYTKSHSIYLSSIMKNDGEVDPEAQDIFIHEASHMLMNKVVNNNSSPVKRNSKMEKKLKEAIIKDIKHRKTIDKSKLANDQKKVWGSLVDNLENHETYFEKPFDQEIATEEQWHEMYTESIVRIMEMRAGNVSKRDIMAVAPNLCNFYYNYTKPMLEDYASGGSPSKFIEKQESLL